MIKDTALEMPVEGSAAGEGLTGEHPADPRPGHCSGLSQPRPILRAAIQLKGHEVSGQPGPGQAHRHLPSLVGARSPEDPAWLHCPVGAEHTNPKTKVDGSNIATPHVISNHQDVRSTFSNSVLGVWFKLCSAPVCGEQRPHIHAPM